MGSFIIKASIRQRKHNIKNDFTNDIKKLQSGLTKARYKAMVEANKDPEYVEKSKRLKTTRNKVAKMTHGGRGGYTHIKMRYVSFA